MNENKNKNNNQRYIMTRETVGMTVLLFCAIIFIMLLTRDIVFSMIGTAVCTFMYGTFGYGSFLVLALLAYLGVWLVWEKSIKISLKCSLVVSLSVFLCFLLFHSVTARNISLQNFGTFVSLCYNNAAQGFSGYTFGGVVSAVFVYPIAKLTTFVGAYIIYGVLFAGSLYLSAVFIRDEIVGKRKSKSKRKTKKSKTKSVKSTVSVQEEPQFVKPEEPHNEISYADPYGATENYQIVDNVPRPIYVNQNQPNYQPENVSQPSQQNDSDKFSSENLGRKILFEKGEFAAESYRRNMIFDENSYFNRPVQSENSYLSSFGSERSSGSKSSSSSSYSESYRQSVENNSGYTPSSYVYGDKPVEKLEDSSLTEGIYKESNSFQPEAEQSEFKKTEPEKFEPETNFGYGAEPTDYNEHVEPSRGYNENYNEFMSDSEPIVRRAQDGRSVSDFNHTDSYNELRPDSEPVVRRSPEGRNASDFNQTENYYENNTGRDMDVGSGFRSEENSVPEQHDEKPVVNNDRDNLNESGGRSSNGLFNLFSSNNPNLSGSSIEPDTSRMGLDRQERSKANLFDEEGEEDELFGSSVNDRISGASEIIPNENETQQVIPERKREMVHITPPTQEMVEAEPPKPKHVWKKYVAPSLDLLQNYSESGSTNSSEIEQNKNAIVETLARVRIESEIINVIVGSKFTRYDVRIKDNTAIKIALKHKDEIQIALRKDTINAYINFKLAALSVEVPNRESGTVGLKSILASSQFLNSKPSSLTFALGKNIEGDCICPDITKMPHLLVAGTTGSGKSICLSSLIVSLLYRYGPDELRFILVDPKQVEFIPYENLPHLMINEIIFDVDKAIKALNWAIKEMERRYQLFKEMTANGVATKDLTEYNSHLPEGEEKLPKIVIILDEFGDLMLQAKKEIETRIVRLVQKARACGIHLILATQRPSVDCITGLIKSNLPTRIGFKVNSFDDSRTIFDIGGAEKLLGAGDMYYRRSDRPELQRVQGCFISSSEVQRVTDFVKANNETYFDDSVSEFINTTEASEENSSSGSSEDGATESDTKIDDTFIKALKYCVTSNQASVSMIQRRFPVGYIKACKIIDWMENMNYITQSEGSKPRKVLLSREEFINTYGEIDD